ncbi:hypothetical protein ISCGN_026008 [Ixodes scapularis]
MLVLAPRTGSMVGDSATARNFARRTAPVDRPLERGYLLRRGTAAASPLDLGQPFLVVEPGWSCLQPALSSRALLEDFASGICRDPAENSHRRADLRWAARTSSFNTKLILHRQVTPSPKQARRPERLGTSHPSIHHCVLCAWTTTLWALGSFRPQDPWCSQWQRFEEGEVCGGRRTTESCPVLGRVHVR